MERVYTVGVLLQAQGAGEASVRALALGAACLVGTLHGREEAWSFRTQALMPSLPPDAKGAGLHDGMSVIPLRVPESSVPGKRARPYLVGRATTNDVAINHKSVSKIHARIHQHDDGRWTVEDADSRNGTFVGGERVRSAPVALKDGDSVMFGSQALAFFTTPFLLNLLRFHPGARR